MKSEHKMNSTKDLFLCSVVFFLVSIAIFCSFVSYCSCQVSYNSSLTVELTCAIKLLLLLVAFSGEKDHYFVDMADDVVRGSSVSHEVVSYVRMLGCVNVFVLLLCDAVLAKYVLCHVSLCQSAHHKSVFYQYS